MDMQTIHDIETMAEWAATQDAYQRMLERRARRRSWLRFVFNWRQIADDPPVAVPASGAQRSPIPAPSGPPGAGSAAAGFRDGHAVGPYPRGVGEPTPRRPHHF